MMLHTSIYFSLHHTVRGNAICDTYGGLLPSQATRDQQYDASQECLTCAARHERASHGVDFEPHHQT